MKYLNQYINRKLSNDDYDIITLKAKKEIEELLKKQKGKFKVENNVKKDRN